MKRLFLLVLIFPFVLLAEDKIKIGVQTTLSGDGAIFGTDTKNGLLYANEHYFNNKYEFIFEDDKCTAKGGVETAQRMVSVHKVRYVLGVACNEVLLASAPIYQRHSVVVISAYATSGDKEEVGDKIFRPLTAENVAAELLYKFVSAKHKNLFVFTEQNEYPVMVERALKKASQNGALKIFYDSFVPGVYDHRTVLAKIKSQTPDALFFNTNAEAGFIELVKQAKELGLTAQIYALYWPASSVTLEALGNKADGIVFANPPILESLLTDEGRSVVKDYRDKYGEPLTSNLLPFVAIDTLRILDQAIDSKQPVDSYIRQIAFKGLLGTIVFDQNGAGKGIPFEMQKIEAGKVKLLDEAHS